MLSAMSKASRDRAAWAEQDERMRATFAAWTGRDGANGSLAVPATHRHVEHVATATLLAASDALQPARPLGWGQVGAEPDAGVFEAWTFDLGELPRFRGTYPAAAPTYGKRKSAIDGPMESRGASRSRSSSVSVPTTGRPGGSTRTASVAEPCRRSTRHDRSITPERICENLLPRLTGLEVMFSRERVRRRGTDVIAWLSDPVERWLAIECKATGQTADKIKIKQARWRRSARSFGLSDDDYAVAEVLVRQL